MNPVVASSSPSVESTALIPYQPPVTLSLATLGSASSASSSTTSRTPPVSSTPVKDDFDVDAWAKHVQEAIETAATDAKNEKEQKDDKNSLKMLPLTRQTGTQHSVNSPSPKMERDVKSELSTTVSAPTRASLSSATSTSLTSSSSASAAVAAAAGVSAAVNPPVFSQDPLVSPPPTSLMSSSSVSSSASPTVLKPEVVSEKDTKAMSQTKTTKPEAMERESKSASASTASPLTIEQEFAVECTSKNANTVIRKIGFYVGSKHVFSVGKDPKSPLRKTLINDLKEEQVIVMIKVIRSKTGMSLGVPGQEWIKLLQSKKNPTK